MNWFERSMLILGYVGLLTVSLSLLDSRDRLKKLEESPHVILVDRDIKIGDIVIPLFTPRYGKVLAIDGDKAWVKSEGGYARDETYLLKTLAKVVTR